MAIITKVAFPKIYQSGSIIKILKEERMNDLLMLIEV